MIDMRWVERTEVVHLFRRKMNNPPKAALFAPPYCPNQL